MPSPLRPPPRGPESRRDPARLPANHRLPIALRLDLGSAAEPGAVEGLGIDPRQAWIEAALLAADEPLTARRLAQAAGLADAAEARRLVRKLQTGYDEIGTAFQVEEVAGGFQLLTRPEYHRWLVRLRQSGTNLHLTGAARETLAIVAYRQPITRADVEGIRGVHCGEVLRLLMEKGLIRITGRHDSLGRPVLYGTTKKFLQVFGLRSLRDLPLADQLRLPGEGKKPPMDAEEPGPV